MQIRESRYLRDTVKFSMRLAVRSMLRECRTREDQHQFLSPYFVYCRQYSRRAVRIDRRRLGRDRPRLRIDRRIEAMSISIRARARQGDSLDWEFASPAQLVSTRARRANAANQGDAE